MKVVKNININVDSCTGCRSCEMACSAFHAEPRYSSLNPARSRIRVYVDEINDVYIPVRGGHYSRAECNGRNLYNIDAKQYAECALCSAVCPSRDRFKQPDSGMPLQCDMCEDIPPLPEPMCVQACKFGALTYEVREAEGTEETDQREDIAVGLEALADRYGMQLLMDAVSRMSNSSKSNLDS